MTAWTDDRGRLDQRLATMYIEELHRVVVDTAIDGIRRGVPAELLDGQAAARAGRFLGFRLDRRSNRLKHLEEMIGEAETEAKRARRNANLTDDEKLARELLTDAAKASTRAIELRDEREQLASSTSPALGLSFSSEADYVAHALARLRSVSHDTDSLVADALSQILEFTDADTTSEPEKVLLTFYVLVPADGSVARLGPLVCRVENHAYAGTIGTRLPPSVREHPLVVAALGHGLFDRLRHKNEHAVLMAVGEALREKGYTALAASTLTRAWRQSLLSVVVHDLFGDPVPDTIDGSYVSHVMAVYKDPAFAWNARYYDLDPAPRQALVDAIVDAGGSLVHEEAIALLSAQGIGVLTLNGFTRDQRVGKAPVWPACVRRGGDWRRGSHRRRDLRRHRWVELVPCPHCGASATVVRRTPETAVGLLCRSCRRSIDPGSPIYPDDYLTGGLGIFDAELGDASSGRAASGRAGRESPDGRYQGKAELHPERVGRGPDRSQFRRL